MLAIIARQRVWLAGLALFAALVPDVSLAGLDEVSGDGWYSWKSPAAQTASNWCCFSWNAGRAQRKDCDLDGRHGGYGSSRDAVASPDEIQVYVFMQNGEPQKIRALGSQCPVTTETQILFLGVVDSAESVRWLERQVLPRSDISTHALAAISAHDGDDASGVLIDIVQSNSSIENRKDALFWLAQSGSDEAMTFISRLLVGN